MDLSKHVNTKYINLNVCSQAGKIISTQYNGSYNSECGVYINRHDKVQYTTKTFPYGTNNFKKDHFYLYSCLDSLKTP